MNVRRRCTACGQTYHMLFRAQVCPCQIVMGDRAPLDMQIARFWEQWEKKQNRTHVESSKGESK